MSARKSRGRGGVVLELRLRLLFDESIQPIRVGRELLGGRRRIRGAQRRQVDAEDLDDVGVVLLRERAETRIALIHDLGLQVLARDVEAPTPILERRDLGTSSMARKILPVSESKTRHAASWVWPTMSRRI